VRGEKLPNKYSYPIEPGSSPRAWGKVSRGHHLLSRERIIPTCVGKRTSRTRPAPACADHPHVRGEKDEIGERIGVQLGSSPRAWGKAGRRRRGHPRSRIIPTCVGKRPAPNASPAPSPDHPHVRGEKLKRRRIHDECSGSSPRAWGKAQMKPLQPQRARIIPTCVGKRAIPRSRK